MNKVNGKMLRRVVKVLVLVVAPWFTTGCAGLAALAPILSGLGSVLGGIGKLAPASAATVTAGGVNTAAAVSPTTSLIPKLPFLASAQPIAGSTNDTLKLGTGF